MRKLAGLLGIVALCALPAVAAVTSTTTTSPIKGGLDGLMSSTDLIQGKIATELPGDMGWHPANPNPADQLAAFTDGIGFVGGSGVTGLLNDFPPDGNPVKRIQYNLDAPADITGINIFSTNNEDGRVFSTSVINYSTGGGVPGSWQYLGYFQSHPSGTINMAGNPASIGIKSTMVSVFDNANPIMLTGVTNLRIFFYSVDNTGGQMRDPFGNDFMVNPFTLTDDGLTTAFVSPLIHEIDILPEPASLMLLALGGVLLRRRSA